VSLVAPILGLVLGVAVIALVVEAVTERRERRLFTPPGRLVDVGGHRLHLLATGQGHPGPIVILDAGMISFSSNWAWVQPAVAEFARVVAYDRAGLGWSDPGPKPRDAGQSARELHAALQAADLDGPYVLAGHSYGGLAVRAFAILFPDDVAGMVLVDGSHPDQWIRFGVSSRVLGFSNKVSGALARFGLFRVFDKEFRLLADGLPDRAHAELMALSRTPRAFSTAGDAALAWDERTRPLVDAAGGLGDLPLVVISVTEQPRMGDKLTALQAELPALSSQSKHITVEGAYHEGLLAQAESARVVTQSIREVVEAARTGRPLAPTGVPVASAGSTHDGRATR
jgi:pimeloyl-ACP methyl ester carboxylesterase